MISLTQTGYALVAYVAFVAVALLGFAPSIASAYYHKPVSQVGAFASTGDISVSGKYFTLNNHSWAKTWVSDEASSNKHGQYWRHRQAVGEASQTVNVSGNHASVYVSGVSSSAFIY